MRCETLDEGPRERTESRRDGGNGRGEKGGDVAKERRSVEVWVELPKEGTELPEVSRSDPVFSARMERRTPVETNSARRRSRSSSESSPRRTGSRFGSASEQD